MTERSNDLQALRTVQWLLAEGEILAGRPDAACTRLAPLCDRPGLEGDFLLPRLAWAHLERGDVGRAQEVVALALSQAHGHRNQVALVEVLRVQALVAIRLARWEAAEQALEEALSLTRRMFQGYPHAAARLEQVYGLMHVQKGEPGPAHERLEAALALFRGLGACKEAERVEQAIGALYSVPPRATGD